MILLIVFELCSWVKLGAAKEKLIIGMPTYGRSFTLANPQQYIVNSPATGGGDAGIYTGEEGFMSYYEVSYWQLTELRELRINSDLK